MKVYVVVRNDGAMIAFVDLDEANNYINHSPRLGHDGESYFPISYTTKPIECIFPNKKELS